jgi:hypothetical protein
MKHNVSMIIYGLSLALCFSACEKEEEEPGVKPVVQPTEGPALLTTTAASDITFSSATVGGKIAYAGTPAYTERGVCYGTSENPTVDDTKVVVSGSGTGTFFASLTNLTANTVYHFRAYAVNKGGTAYGSDMSLTTEKGPEIVFDYIENAFDYVAATSVRLGINITSDSGSPITERGFCWSTTTTEPTTADNKVASGSGKGVYYAEITNLSPLTKYHARAYAINEAGTTYSSFHSTFETVPDLVKITTAAVSDITPVSVVSGGNITSDGGTTILERGIYWSTNPNKPDTKVADSGSGLGEFTVEIGNLSPNTTYYVWAYIISEYAIWKEVFKQTYYGNKVAFKTAALVTTAAVSNVTATSATSGGTIADNGGSAITERGVCWSIAYNPTTTDSKTVSGSGTGAFTADIPGLHHNTTYYVRAYAIDEKGTTHYGEEVSFTTESPVKLTTAVAPGDTKGTAVFSGDITDAGGQTIRTRGFCRSTAPNPQLGILGTTTSVSPGWGTGRFSLTETLTPGTTYYVRAVAVDEMNVITYGNEVTFTLNADGVLSDIDNSRDRGGHLKW